MRPRALVLSALSLGTGSGLRAAYLAQALERLGWDARLAAPAGGPRPYSAEMLGGLPRLMRAALAPVDLAVAVKPYPDAWGALALARARGAVAVVDVDDADGGYRGGALALLTRALQAPAYLAAPFISTHHPLLKARLQAAHGARRVLDLPQGVDLESFDALPRRREGRAWRRAQGLGPAPLLGFCAHLNVACQLEFLLEAAGPWLRRHPRAALVVAGGGPEEAAFRALARPWGGQVRFLGPVTPRQAAQVMAACDVNVSAYGPSEGNRYRVPMKVAESLALGRPVVSNLVPGLMGLKPYLFECSLQPDAYGRALDRALAGGAARARRGQAWVRRHLDWTGVAARFLASLRSVQPGLARGAGEPA
jgi:glycosyltransferase involved in cell wall biosynthesis